MAKGFAKRFYERLFEKDVRIRKAFENTQLERQEQLVEHGVYMLIMFAEGKAAGEMALDRLGRLHDSQHLNISPDLYPLWIEAVIDTLKELEDEFDDDLEGAWRTSLAKGVEHLVSMYRA